MESMTGYSYVEAGTDTFTFSAEIKSLNSKYLEIYVNLPRQLRSEENALIAELKKYFTRGKVELTIEILQWLETRPQTINAELVKKYYRELKKIHDSLKIPGALAFESVLRLDGITQRTVSGISAQARAAIQKAVAEAARKTVRMRLKEGKAVQKDIMRSLAEIGRLSAAAARMARVSAAEKKKALTEKLRSLYPEIADARIFSEIALLTDKLDVNEEVIRLADHIKKFREIAADSDQTGRRLDFLAQEMFREINTMGSKSNSSEISHLVVEMKNHIDRIREHCRNIA